MCWQIFTPLVDKCKSLNRAMRIGTNHGSLSARILSYYGDTPRCCLPCCTTCCWLAAAHPSGPTPYDQFGDSTLRHTMPALLSARCMVALGLMSMTGGCMSPCPLRQEHLMHSGTVAFSVAADNAGSHGHGINSCCTASSATCILLCVVLR